MAISLTSIIQYVFLLGAAYVFLGAPILQILTGTSNSNTNSHSQPDDLVYPSGNLTCPPHEYNVHILTRDPLVIYIPNFLSDEEADHLVELA